ncbi:frataxin, mitochondrial isoform X4 [Vigna radiata var. radiata]|uniref:ferroxidase n=1 Tax=Vigna radiata var. radiata TaxID=3916 RepID=A0A1S3TCC6_VIGRR|nr:frataxin, mitochondrial isoform X4 [Vigna radiata var. radiata]
MASKLVLQRRLLRFLQLLAPSSSSSTHVVPFLSVKASECTSLCRKNSLLPSRSYYSRNLSSGSFNLDESQAPLAVDYRSLLDESEFHRLADSTIHSVQEKLEDYGDLVEVDGFDIDYGNDVLTVKLGDLGTYVLNKQTPNRQLWLSSPLSGPSRFDWDRDTKAWIYRRNKANLYKILEGELEQLCGKAIVLS